MLDVQRLANTYATRSGSGMLEPGNELLGNDQRPMGRTMWGLCRGLVESLDWRIEIVKFG